MKVLHLSCVAPPDIGGIGHVASTEVGLLRARGIEADVISLTSHASCRIGNMGVVYALDHLTREADIVHLHYPFYGTQEIIAWLRWRTHLPRLVVTLHMDATARGVKGALFSAHRALIQSSLLHRADALLVSSRDYAEQSSFRLFAGQALEVPFGVDEAVFCPGDPQRDLFGLPADAPVVGMVGGMDRAHAFKGVEVLLEALRGMAGVHALFVGEGVLRSMYERVACARGVHERCHFIGRVPMERLPDVYRSVDLVAVPSTSVAEAFSLVAVEAQACGIPVVASHLPGVRTVVADGETGFLVPPRDSKSLEHALTRLIQDRSRRQAMGQRGRERVLEKFTWQRHVTSLIDMYQRLCASPSSPTTIHRNLPVAQASLQRRTQRN